jgi:hypothetical protein
LGVGQDSRKGSVPVAETPKIDNRTDIKDEGFMGQIPTLFVCLAPILCVGSKFGVGYRKA